jgi:hypothetical protein
MVRDWPEDGDDCAECGVLFELEGVSFLPVFRRTARGYALVRGADVLAPLTPLRIRCVNPVGSEGTRVLLSGVVAGGYVLGSMGRWIRGRGSGFEMAIAEYHRGMELWFRREFAASARALEKAAMRGHAESMRALGEMLKVTDPKVSFEWLEKAAAMGHPDAMCQIARICLGGAGLRVDGIAAQKWLRKAVELGSVLAMAKLGELFRDGVGVPVDKAEAMRWFRKAGALGLTAAIFCVGALYAEGGVGWLTTRGRCVGTGKRLEWVIRARCAGSGCVSRPARVLRGTWRRH